MITVILRIALYCVSASLIVVFAYGGMAVAEGAMLSLSYAGKVPPARPSLHAWGKDPFVPLVVQKAEAKEKGPVGSAMLRLTAVFFSDLRPSAIINDKIVYVGGVIDGQKIVDIGRTHVILHGVSGRVRLDMAGGAESQ